uniref:Putative YopX protein n=1 Tax=viral metagenome TaxID=1070528 RepID=A0A6M3KDS7_9ZZZZ
MREIKFRAWHVKDLRFYYFDIETVTQTYYPGYYHPITGEKDCELTDPTLYEEKQLFTGLFDKNDKEIYEGDILLIEDEWTQQILDDGSGPREPANHLSPVTFKNGSFGVVILESADIFRKGFWAFPVIETEIGDLPGEMQVIGNIYENPELL